MVSERQTASERYVMHLKAGRDEREVVRTWLLGSFSISVGSRVVGEQGWRLKKAASLVKLLALTSHHRMHRERVMEALWPELSPKAAANNLHQALRVARVMIEPEPHAPRYLSLRGEQLALCPNGDAWVDVEVFEEAAATARRIREPAAYRAAVELYAGELLPGDRYEEWAEERREELRALYLELLVDLAKVHEAREEFSSGVEALEKVVSEEPAHEEANARLMSLYALAGRPQAALRRYERFAVALARARGGEPDVSIRRLYEDIFVARFPSAAGQTPVSDTAPLSHPPRPGGHNLPVGRTSFLGREDELPEVKRKLAMTGLLTLTGTGGSGKTRLALEIARDLVGAYPDLNERSPSRTSKVTVRRGSSWKGRSTVHPPLS